MQLLQEIEIIPTEKLRNKVHGNYLQHIIVTRQTGKKEYMTSISNTACYHHHRHQTKTKRTLDTHPPMKHNSREPVVEHLQEKVCIPHLYNYSKASLGWRGNKESLNEEDHSPLLVIMAATDKEGGMEAARRWRIRRGFVHLLAPLACLLLFLIPFLHFFL